MPRPCAAGARPASDEDDGSLVRQPYRSPRGAGVLVGIRGGSRALWIAVDDGLVVDRPVGSRALHRHHQVDPYTLDGVEGARTGDGGVAGAGKVAVTEGFGAGRVAEGSE